MCIAAISPAYHNYMSVNSNNAITWRLTIYLGLMKGRKFWQQLPGLRLQPVWTKPGFFLCSALVPLTILFRSPSGEDRRRDQGEGWAFLTILGKGRSLYVPKTNEHNVPREGETEVWWRWWHTIFLYLLKLGRCASRTSLVHSTLIYFWPSKARKGPY